MSSWIYVFILLSILIADVLQAKEDRFVDRSELPEIALTMPQGSDSESILIQRLEDVFNDFDLGKGSYSTALELAILYHANGYENRAEALYLWLVDRSEPGKSKAALYYRLAHLVQEKGDSKRATVYFEKGANEFADYPQLHVALGEAKLKQGESEKAAEHFRRAILIEKYYAPAVLGLARVYVFEGEDTLATNTLSELLLYDENNYNAKALLAGLLERRGEVEQARFLRLAISHSSSAPSADPWMSVVDNAILDPQRLDFRFLDCFMVGEYELALGYLERMEWVDPKNLRNYRYRALYHLERGELNLAEYSLLEGLAIKDNDEELYTLLVKCLRRKGDLRAAMAVARDGLSREPGSHKLQLEEAYLLVESGKSAEAASILQKLLAANPYLLEAHLLHARLASQLGSEDKGEESFQAILQLAPSDAEVLVRAALIKLESGRFDGAIPFLERALQVAPGYSEAVELLADAYFELGRLAFQSGKMDEAINLLSQSLVYNTSHLEAQTSMVKAYLKQGRLEEAEVSMLSFLREAGPHPLYLMMYGDLLVRAGKTMQAKEIWNRALVSLNGDAQSQRLRKSLYQRLGR